MCVTVCVSVGYGLFLGPAWMSEFVVLHAWIGLHPPIQPLRHSSLSASFLPSVYPSFSKWTLRMLEWELHCGREERTRMHWPVSEWTCGNRECIWACICVFMFLLGDALSSALLHSDSGWKSLLASSLRPYYRLNQLCLCVCVWPCVSL